MNGNRTAEQYAEIASEAAQRATQKAQTAVNASMEAKQAVSFMERELGDLRTEMNDGFTELTKLIRQGPYRSTTLTHEDFEETPTGSYKISRDTYSSKVARDARRWRAMWRRRKTVSPLKKESNMDWKWDWQHVVIGVAGLACMTAVIVLGHGQTAIQLVAALGGTSGALALLKRSPGES